MSKKTTVQRTLILAFLFCFLILYGCRQTPEGPVVLSPRPADATALPSAGQTAVSQPTPTPTLIATPTLAPGVTPVPGGKTSTNPNYAGKKIIALTFDDGPDPLDTPALLDMLKEKNVPVTFFVLGQECKSAEAQAILRREAEEGHEIGSHSYSHKSFKTISDEEIKKEMADTAALIRQATGLGTVLFRPPSGSYNQHIAQTCGAAIVLWNIDSLDWEHIHYKYSILPYAQEHNISTEEATDILVDELVTNGYYNSSGEWVKPLVKQVSHGSILLFHDIHPATRLAVARLIDALNETGEYMFMTVSDLIKSEGRAPEAGDVYRTMWEAYTTGKVNWK